MDIPEAGPILGSHPNVVHGGYGTWRLWYTWYIPEAGPILGGHPNVVHGGYGTYLSPAPSLAATLMWYMEVLFERGRVT